MENLFVYGTLMQSQCRQSVLGKGVKIIGEDRLDGYGTTIIKDDEDYFVAAQPKINCSVEGIVLFVSSEDLVTLDEYEGDIYERVSVKLCSGDTAWAYVLKSS